MLSVVAVVAWNVVVVEAVLVVVLGANVMVEVSLYKDCIYFF